MIKWLFKNRSGFQIAFKNSVWLFSANVISRLFKFYLVIYAARILGPEKYGVFYYTIYLFAFLFMFADLGLAGLFSREYQRDEFDRSELTSTTFFLKIALSMISTLGAVVAFFFVTDPLVKAIFMVLLARLILDNLRNFFAILANANHRAEYYSFSFVIETVVTTGVGIWFLRVFGSLESYAWAYFIGTSIGLLSILWLVRKIPFGGVTV